MRSGRALATLIAVVCAACSSDGPSHPSSDDRGIAVIITGVLTADGTVCPADQAACLTGIPLEGDLGALRAGDQLLARGQYDGRRLLLSEVPSAAQIPIYPADRPELCPGMSNPADTVADGHHREVDDVLGGGGGGGGVGQASDSLAEVWWSEKNHVMTYWFARDLDLYSERLQAVFGTERVCLADGAEFSQRELADANAAVAQLVQRDLFAIEGGWGIDAGRNRVLVPIEAIDAEGRRELDKLQAVVAVPFIELLDRPLAELPRFQGVATGNVDLLTSSTRSTGGMAAQLVTRLQYDADGNCVYFEDGSMRGTVLWPLGSVANLVDGVVTVVDAAGHSIAVTGQRAAFAGGIVPAVSLHGVDGNNYCGASNVFVVAA